MTLLRAVRTLTVLFACGCTLLLLAWPSLGAIPLGAAEGLARGLYRVIFFFCLPAHFVVEPLAPLENHHWPLSYHVGVCLVAPYLWYGVLWVWLRVYRACSAPIHKPVSGKDSDCISRRQLMLLAGTGAPLLAGSAVGAYSVLLTPQRLRVRDYRIPLRNLPAALDGMRIIHVSDTHYGPYVSEPYLRRVMGQVNDLQGDVVILTGDYVHRTPRSVERGIRLLGDIEARLGIAAVLGNHDHWEGAEACRALFSEIGIPLIDNDRLFLTSNGLQAAVGSEAAICLAGVGDLWEDDVSFERALRGVPGNMPRIVLAHNPDAAELLGAEHRVDLMCCGHTHGGQVCLPGLGTPIVPSKFGSKYAGGLVQGPHCRVLVSRGVGIALLPVRFRVPPELVVFELTRGADPE